MPGSKYWKKRMLAIEKQKNQMSIECVQAAEKQFNIAKKNIEKDLARWYIRLADNNDISLAEAKKLLDKKELEEFKWTVDEYIKKGELIKYHPEWEQQLENASARVHISRLESIKLQLQQETELLYGRFNEDISKHLKGIYENGYYRTAFEIQKGYGIVYSLHQLDSRKIDVALRTAWAQDGNNFSDRIWQQKNKLVNELNTVLVQNVIRGKDVEKSITDMAKKLDVSKKSAGRLIMTESAAIHAKSQHECFKELDVEEFEFVATLDMKTSEICREMDGKHFKMSEYEIGITVPPLHPWCRSVTVPYFSDDFEDIMGKRAARGENGKTYYVPADMTYPEWKESFVENDSILNSGGEIVYPITTQSIDNVPLIKVGNMSDDEAYRLQTEHKKLLDYAKENNHSCEVGVLFDDNLNEINRALGNATSIDLNISGRTKAKYVIHNHPNNASFSNRDLNWLIRNENVRYFSIVKNNGAVEVLHILDNFNRGIFKIEYERLEKKYMKEIEKDKDKGYTKVVEKLLTKTKSGLVYVR